MKCLVATERTQGDAQGDYTYCVPGELIWVTMVCDTDRLDPEGGCGCGRGFGGLTSHRATTTAEVVDLDLTEDDVRLAVTTSLSDRGWLPAELAGAHREIVEETIGLVRALADPLPVGTVVRRRVDEFHALSPHAPH